MATKSTTSLSDVLIISDIDGTLLRATVGIPQKNITALERFVGKGGHFTLATGRSNESVRQYAEQLPINTPAVLFNGGSIYDFSTGKQLYVQYLPDSARGYVKAIMAEFPEIGAYVVQGDFYYNIASHPVEDKFQTHEQIPIIDKDADEISGEWYKILFFMQPETMPHVKEFVRQQGCLTDVDIVATNEFYLEMLPKGVHKGATINRMVDMFGFDMQHVYGIGDYYNDIEMLQTVGFPVTVAGAPDEIKKICKLVVCDCLDGALSDLVEYIETQYEHYQGK